MPSENLLRELHSQLTPEQFERFRARYWRILPPGRMPWEQLRQEIEPIVQSAPEGKRPFILHRLKTINEFNPYFAAIGTAGFRGYMILGFKDKKIYVYESQYCLSMLNSGNPWLNVYITL